ncbi:MAG: carboxypeptidase regulatory-like domain-containing protein [Armatimonadetes bacterium]|nr:carboxypeptidase regulatory-like domain-containing protein [Armatimonadota bacterium]
MRYRLLLGIAVLLMFTPTFLYFAGPLRAPLTFEGDRVVELKAREVEGRYVPIEDAQSTDYELREFIIPGQHRPVRVTGTVFDAADEKRRIARAAVKLKAQGLELQKETSEQGQFGLDLPPGRYALEISAPGYQTYAQEYVVEHSTEPIPAHPVEYAWRFVELPVAMERIPAP